MSTPKLIVKKHPRGEYEIGTFTEDGAIVARVTIWDGRGIDTRPDAEKEDIAIDQARRLLKALQQALDD
jgi:hypothetical protein